jgi:hypothetical protein
LPRSKSALSGLRSSLTPKCPWAIRAMPACEVTAFPMKQRRAFPWRRLYADGLFYYFVFASFW